uniref:NADH-ubiquinone oxidoreductase chain 4L n=1 Tax=Perna viridis TaxID=73031 RepID=I6QD47_PERVI|nr:NADH dehydrogenase subunit 4L [Perna viridis]AFK75952.1 NADH dehydrogenase subunit 4L [Perna viridis]UJM44261.1 NADH dehydrogenase subunit 4L [Perna viridis]
MYKMSIFFFLLFFSGVLVVLLKKGHLISIFIGMEFMMLGVLYSASIMMCYNVSMVFLIMCLGVCEASVCLALLVMMVRLSGNDLISSLSLY